MDTCTNFNAFVADREDRKADDLTEAFHELEVKVLAELAADPAT